MVGISVHLVKYSINYAPPYHITKGKAAVGRSNINNDAATHKFPNNYIFKNDVATLFSVIYISIINDAAARIDMIECLNDIGAAALSV
jgi:hypothetical protein